MFRRLLRKLFARLFGWQDQQPSPAGSSRVRTTHRKPGRKPKTVQEKQTKWQTEKK